MSANSAACAMSRFPITRTTSRFVSAVFSPIDQCLAEICPFDEENNLLANLEDARSRRYRQVFGQSINCAATVAPSSQQDSRSSLVGLPDTNTYSAAFTQPSPVVIAVTPRSAPSVPSLPWR